MHRCSRENVMAMTATTNKDDKKHEDRSQCCADTKSKKAAMKNVPETHNSRVVSEGNAYLPSRQTHFVSNYKSDEATSRPTQNRHLPFKTRKKSSVRTQQRSKSSGDSQKSRNVYYLEACRNCNGGERNNLRMYTLSESSMKSGDRHLSDSSNRSKRSLASSKSSGDEQFGLTKRLAAKQNSFKANENSSRSNNVQRRLQISSAGKDHSLPASFSSQSGGSRASVISRGRSKKNACGWSTDTGSTTRDESKCVITVEKTPKQESATMKSRSKDNPIEQREDGSLQKNRSERISRRKPPINSHTSTSARRDDIVSSVRRRVGQVRPATTNASTGKTTKTYKKSVRSQCNSTDSRSNLSSSLKMKKKVPYVEITRKPSADREKELHKYCEGESTNKRLQLSRDGNKKSTNRKQNYQGFAKDVRHLKNHERKVARGGSAESGLQDEMNAQANPSMKTDSLARPSNKRTGSARSLPNANVSRSSCTRSTRNINHLDEYLWKQKASHTKVEKCRQLPCSRNNRDTRSTGSETNSSVGEEKSDWSSDLGFQCGRKTPANDRLVAAKHGDIKKESSSKSRGRTVEKIASAKRFTEHSSNKKKLRKKESTRNKLSEVPKSKSRRPNFVSVRDDEECRLTYREPETRSDITTKRIRQRNKSNRCSSEPANEMDYFENSLPRKVAGNTDAYQSAKPREMELSRKNDRARPGKQTSVNRGKWLSRKGDVEDHLTSNSEKEMIPHDDSIYKKRVCGCRKYIVDTTQKSNYRSLCHSSTRTLDSANTEIKSKSKYTDVKMGQHNERKRGFDFEEGTTSRQPLVLAKKKRAFVSVQSTDSLHWSSTASTGSLRARNCEFQRRREYTDKDARPIDQSDLRPIRSPPKTGAGKLNPSTKKRLHQEYLEPENIKIRTVESEQLRHRLGNRCEDTTNWTKCRTCTNTANRKGILKSYNVDSENYIADGTNVSSGMDEEEKSPDTRKDVPTMADSFQAVQRKSPRKYGADKASQKSLVAIQPGPKKITQIVPETQRNKVTSGDTRLTRSIAKERHLKEALNPDILHEKKLSHMKGSNSKIRSRKSADTKDNVSGKELIRDKASRKTSAECNTEDPKKEEKNTKAKDQKPNEAEQRSKITGRHSEERNFECTSIDKSSNNGYSKEENLFVRRYGVEKETKKSRENIRSGIQKSEQIVENKPHHKNERPSATKPTGSSGKEKLSEASSFCSSRLENLPERKSKEIPAKERTICQPQKHLVTVDEVKGKGMLTMKTPKKDDKASTTKGARQQAEESESKIYKSPIGEAKLENTRIDNRLSTDISIKDEGKYIRKYGAIKVSRNARGETRRGPESSMQIVPHRHFQTNEMSSSSISSSEKEGDIKRSPFHSSIAEKTTEKQFPCQKQYQVVDNFQNETNTSSVKLEKVSAKVYKKRKAESKCLVPRMKNMQKKRIQLGEHKDEIKSECTSIDKSSEDDPSTEARVLRRKHGADNLSRKPRGKIRGGTEKDVQNVSEKLPHNKEMSSSTKSTSSSEQSPLKERKFASWTTKNTGIKISRQQTDHSMDGPQSEKKEHTDQGEEGNNKKEARNSESARTDKLFANGSSMEEKFRRRYGTDHVSRKSRGRIRRGPEEEMQNVSKKHHHKTHMSNSTKSTRSSGKERDLKESNFYSSKTEKTTEEKYPRSIESKSVAQFQKETKTPAIKEGKKSDHASTKIKTENKSARPEKDEVEIKPNLPRRYKDDQKSESTSIDASSADGSSTPERNCIRKYGSDKVSRKPRGSIRGGPEKVEQNLPKNHHHNKQMSSGTKERDLKESNVNSLKTDKTTERQTHHQTESKVVSQSQRNVKKPSVPQGKVSDKASKKTKTHHQSVGPEKDKAEKKPILPENHKDDRKLGNLSSDVSSADGSSSAERNFIRKYGTDKVSRKSRGNIRGFPEKVVQFKPKKHQHNMQMSSKSTSSSGKERQLNESNVNSLKADKTTEKKTLHHKESKLVSQSHRRITKSSVHQEKVSDKSSKKTKTQNKSVDSSKRTVEKKPILPGKQKDARKLENLTRDLSTVDDSSRKEITLIRKYGADKVSRKARGSIRGGPKEEVLNVLNKHHLNKQMSSSTKSVSSSGKERNLKESNAYLSKTGKPTERKLPRQTESQLADSSQKAMKPPVKQKKVEAKVEISDTSSKKKKEHRVDVGLKEDKVHRKSILSRMHKIESKSERTSIDKSSADGSSTTERKCIIKYGADNVSSKSRGSIREGFEENVQNVPNKHHLTKQMSSSTKSTRSSGKEKDLKESNFDSSKTEKNTKRKLPRKTESQLADISQKAMEHSVKQEKVKAKIEVRKEHDVALKKDKLHRKSILSGKHKYERKSESTSTDESSVDGSSAGDRTFVAKYGADDLSKDSRKSVREDSEEDVQNVPKKNHHFKQISSSTQSSGSSEGEKDLKESNFNSSITEESTERELSNPKESESEDSSERETKKALVKQTIVTRKKKVNCKSTTKNLEESGDSMIVGLRKSKEVRNLDQPGKNRNEITRIDQFSLDGSIKGDINFRGKFFTDRESRKPRTKIRQRPQKSMQILPQKHLKIKESSASQTSSSRKVKSLEENSSFSSKTANPVKNESVCKQPDNVWKENEKGLTKIPKPEDKSGSCNKNMLSKLGSNDQKCNSKISPEESVKESNKCHLEPPQTQAKSRNEDYLTYNDVKTPEKQRKILIETDPNKERVSSVSRWRLGKVHKYTEIGEYTQLGKNVETNSSPQKNTEKMKEKSKNETMETDLKRCEQEQGTQFNVHGHIFEEKKSTIVKVDRGKKDSKENESQEPQGDANAEFKHTSMQREEGAMDQSKRKLQASAANKGEYKKISDLAVQKPEEGPPKIDIRNPSKKTLEKEHEDIKEVTQEKYREKKMQDMKSEVNEKIRENSKRYLSTLDGTNLNEIAAKDSRAANEEKVSRDEVLKNTELGKFKSILKDLDSKEIDRTKEGTHLTYEESKEPVRCRDDQSRMNEVSTESGGRIVEYKASGNKVVEPEQGFDEGNLENVESKELSRCPCAHSLHKVQLGKVEARNLIKRERYEREVNGIEHKGLGRKIGKYEAGDLREKGPFQPEVQGMGHTGPKRKDKDKAGDLKDGWPCEKKVQGMEHKGSGKQVEKDEARDRRERESYEREVHGIEHKGSGRKVGKDEAGDLRDRWPCEREVPGMRHKGPRRKVGKYEAGDLRNRWPCERKLKDKESTEKRRRNEEDQVMGELTKESGTGPCKHTWKKASYKEIEMGTGDQKLNQIKHMKTKRTPCERKLQEVKIDERTRATKGYYLKDGKASNEARKETDEEKVNEKKFKGPELKMKNEFKQEKKITWKHGKEPSRHKVDDRNELESKERKKDHDYFTCGMGDKADEGPPKLYFRNLPRETLCMVRKDMQETMRNKQKEKNKIVSSGRRPCELGRREPLDKVSTRPERDWSTDRYERSKTIRRNGNCVKETKVGQVFIKDVRYQIRDVVTPRVKLQHSAACRKSGRTQSCAVSKRSESVPSPTFLRNPSRKMLMKIRKDIKEELKRKHLENKLAKQSAPVERTYRERSRMKIRSFDNNKDFNRNTRLRAASMAPQVEVETHAKTSDDKPKVPVEMPKLGKPIEIIPCPKKNLQVYLTVSQREQRMICSRAYERQQNRAYPKGASGSRCDKITFGSKTAPNHDPRTYSSDNGKMARLESTTMIHPSVATISSFRSLTNTSLQIRSQTSKKSISTLLSLTNKIPQKRKTIDIIEGEGPSVFASLAKNVTSFSDSNVGHNMKPKSSDVRKTDFKEKMPEVTLRNKSDVHLEDERNASSDCLISYLISNNEVVFSMTRPKYNASKSTSFVEENDSADQIPASEELGKTPPPSEADTFRSKDLVNEEWTLLEEIPEKEAVFSLAQEKEVNQLFPPTAEAIAKDKIRGNERQGVKYYCTHVKNKIFGRARRNSMTAVSTTALVGGKKRNTARKASCFPKYLSGFLASKGRCEENAPYKIDAKTAFPSLPSRSRREIVAQFLKTSTPSLLHIEKNEHLEDNSEILEGYHR